MSRFPRKAPTHRIKRIGLVGGFALTLALGAQAVSVAGASATNHAVVLVSTVKSTTLGSYLVTTKGLTLYTFSLDTRTKSACTGLCAAEWPPLLAPKGAKLSSLVHGVKPSRLGEVKRSNGKLQLTYEGKPLYRFAGDRSAGQMTGQGFDKVWFVALVSPAAVTATPNVAPVTTPAPLPTSTGSSGAHSSSGSSSGSSNPTPTQPPTTTPTQPPPNLGGGGSGGGGGGYGY
jgi:predicted lipoprotein with Yx(FWY)xxD motif